MINFTTHIRYTGAVERKQFEQEVVQKMNEIENLGDDRTVTGVTIVVSHNLYQATICYDRPTEEERAMLFKFTFRERLQILFTGKLK